MRYAFPIKVTTRRVRAVVKHAYEVDGSLGCRADAGIGMHASVVGVIIADSPYAGIDAGSVDTLSATAARVTAIFPLSWIS